MVIPKRGARGPMRVGSTCFPFGSSRHELDPDLGLLNPRKIKKYYSYFTRILYDTCRRDRKKVIKREKNCHHPTTNGVRFSPALKWNFKHPGFVMSSSSSANNSGFISGVDEVLVHILNGRDRTCLTADM